MKVLSGTKLCSKCKKTFPRTEQFWVFRTDRKKVVPASWCKLCRQIASKEYRIRNEDQVTARGKRQYRSLKHQAFQYYSRDSRIECTCCGEDEFVFLSLDHIDPSDRSLHDKPGKKLTGTAFYRWLRDNDYPSIVQVLCHNCNQAKHILGQCPHKMGRW